jgi:hypothetical protein
MEQEGLPRTDYINGKRNIVFTIKDRKWKLKKAIQQNTHILFMPLLGSKNDQKELLLKGVIAVCN